jgi:phospholipase/carboxylesterase
MPRTLFSTLLTPSEGVCTTVLPKCDSIAVRTYTPTGYEPNYAYPLIVLLHGQGGSDQQVMRYAPKICRRNNLYISVRGPVELQRDDDGLPSYGWGRPGEHDETIERHIIKAIEHTRRDFHVHSERIYLAGIHEGAAVAYRIGLAMADKIAGVISINGSMPRPSDGPLFRNPDIKNLRVMIAHGAANERVPLETARRDYLALYGAGCDVMLNTYPATHRVHANMFRDINRWVVSNINRDTLWDHSEEESETESRHG